MLTLWHVAEIWLNGDWQFIKASEDEREAEAAAKAASRKWRNARYRVRKWQEPHYPRQVLSQFI